MIISNKIRCLTCDDIIESTHRHDFKWCSCRTVAVDGGKEYLKRCGYPTDYEELSVLTDDDFDRDTIVEEYNRCIDSNNGDKHLAVTELSMLFDLGYDEISNIVKGI